VTIIVQPATLQIIWDVTPYQVTADAVPGRTLGPEASGIETLDRCVADFVFSKSRTHYDDVRIGISLRCGYGSIISFLSCCGSGDGGSNRAGDE
jgi:hypothetical protein